MAIHLVHIFLAFLCCFPWQCDSATWTQPQRDTFTLGCKSRPKGVDSKRTGPFRVYDSITDLNDPCHSFVCVPFNDTFGIWTKRFLGDRCCFYENFPLLIGQTIILDENSLSDQCSQTEVTCRLEMDKPREHPRIEIRFQQTRCCFFNGLPIKSGEEILYPEKCSVAACRTLKDSTSLELFFEPVFDDCRCCVNGNKLVKNNEWTTDNSGGRNMTCIDGKLFVMDEVLQKEIVNVKVEEAFSKIRLSGAARELFSNCEMCFKGDANAFNFSSTQNVLKEFAKNLNISRTIFVHEIGNEDQMSGIRFLASSLTLSESNSLSLMFYSLYPIVMSFYNWMSQCVTNHCEISQMIKNKEISSPVLNTSKVEETNENELGVIGTNLLHLIRNSQLELCKNKDLNGRILVILVANDNASNIVSGMITGLSKSFGDNPIEQITILVIHLNDIPTGSEKEPPSVIYSVNREKINFKKVLLSKYSYQSTRILIYGMKLALDRRIFDCWSGCHCISPEQQDRKQVQLVSDIKPVFTSSNPDSQTDCFATMHRIVDGKVDLIENKCNFFSRLTTTFPFL